MIWYGRRQHTPRYGMVDGVHQQQAAVLRGSCSTCAHSVDTAKNQEQRHARHGSLYSTCRALMCVCCGEGCVGRWSFWGGERKREGKKRDRGQGKGREAKVGRGRGTYAPHTPMPSGPPALANTTHTHTHITWPAHPVTTPTINPHAHIALAQQRRCAAPTVISVQHTDHSTAHRHAGTRVLAGIMVGHIAVIGGLRLRPRPYLHGCGGSRAAACSA